jgi:hypothetical protein
MTCLLFNALYVVDVYSGYKLLYVVDVYSGCILLYVVDVYSGCILLYFVDTLGTGVACLLCIVPQLCVLLITLPRSSTCTRHLFRFNSLYVVDVLG